MTEDFFILLECVADDEQWKQWEREAEKLEITMDYYLSEFVFAEE